ncbi:DNA polymerase ligase-domain-containing protein [Annulohypoxylon maeteangense]|uniref:DNA polymerase ligase-domain-containing protein n=1 Tax=Annulohypoxylon maeteangense TaxID=1927788 RepID=UPI002008D1BC|nr:DNA polymerase ligase-domain-containing protein [Annulohypoxylon maeteangense]KAI0881519.1 DNA polymerase ligase-domain-containing protein [Annulohypoxylon maeteangense]
MAAKRGPSPQFVGNPFIKKRNLEWSLDLARPSHDSEEGSNSEEALVVESRFKHDGPNAQAIEAGKANIEDHINYFNEILTKATLSPFPNDIPRLSIDNYRNLYESNFGNARGAHFVVHQHDHPIAGTHYDLRLQINETSSASWAIMYGLPGDPKSRRPNRNATETRIHCLWNHLIETASNSTGSLLIWDTGTYTVLPPRKSKEWASSNSPLEGNGQQPELTEQDKLHQAFQARKISLRLNGTRLPHNYTLNLRLTKENDATGRAKSTRAPIRRRRRGGSSLPRGGATRKGKAKIVEPDTSSDPDLYSDHEPEKSEIVNAPAEQAELGGSEVSPMEREIRELEDEEVRRTNAYPGATNSVGSVHQRRWYLSLDKEASGFVRRRENNHLTWELEGDNGNRENGIGEGDSGRIEFPFYVRGVDVERSIVTGRTGADVLRDEGVEGYVGRKGWRPVF